MVVSSPLVLPFYSPCPLLELFVGEMDTFGILSLLRRARKGQQMAIRGNQQMRSYQVRDGPFINLAALPGVWNQ